MLERNLQFINRCVFIAVCSLLWAQGPTRAQEQTPDDLRVLYDEALGNGLYIEAEDAAKALLDRAFREDRRNELSTAELLSDLALAQRYNNDFEAALQNYELAITIVEANKDMLDLALIEPLLGLGNTYIESDRPNPALQHIERALHVWHVNEGPHSIDQTVALEALAKAYRQKGEMRQVADIAERIYLLYSHNFPGKSMELVPVLLKKGQILGEMGDRREERNAYIEAVGIVEQNEGRSSPNLIEPLLNLGNSHEHEYFDIYFRATSKEELPETRLLNKAESFFESAVELARSNDDVDWRMRSEAILALGDFYMVTKEQSRARVYYRDAWVLLTADPQRLGQRRIDLEGVVPLQQPLPDLTIALRDTDGNLSSAMYGTGYIITQFTVTRHGRLEEIGLVEISPERNADIETEVKRSLIRYLYRPRIENGFAVDTPGQTIRYEFPYPKNDARIE